MVHQRIEAAQQMLMRQGIHIDLGHAHRLQPAQYAQFGVGIAQAVEDHGANGVFHRRGVACFAKDSGQSFKAEFFPKLVQRPHIAQRQCRFKSNLRRISH